MIKQTFICDNCGNEAGTYEQLSKTARYMVDGYSIEITPSGNHGGHYQEWCDMCWKKKLNSLLERIRL